MVLATAGENLNQTREVANSLKRIIVQGNPIGHVNNVRSFVGSGDDYPGESDSCGDIAEKDENRRKMSRGASLCLFSEKRRWVKNIPKGESIPRIDGQASACVGLNVTRLVVC